MTRELRARHRHVVLGLALVVPASLAAALAARPDAARSATTPAGTDLHEPAPGTERGRVRAERDGLRVELRLVDAAGSLEGRVRATAPGGVPELLLYASDAAAPAPSLPPDARFLGVVAAGAPSRVPLAGAGGRPPASLLVYDLAHAAVVARLALPRADTRAGGAP